MMRNGDEFLSGIPDLKSYGWADEAIHYVTVDAISGGMVRKTSLWISEHHTHTHNTVYQEGIQDCGQAALF